MWIRFGKDRILSNKIYEVIVKKYENKIYEVIVLCSYSIFRKHFLLTENELHRMYSDLEYKG